MPPPTSFTTYTAKPHLATSQIGTEIIAPPQCAILHVRVGQEFVDGGDHENVDENRTHPAEYRKQKRNDARGGCKCCDSPITQV
ncbi:MAG: hypothetical protein R3E58_02990 [Phycisphaerae bacterium]